MPESMLLDNPIWHSLLTGHRDIAEGGALARRFPAFIGPLAGIADDSEPAWEALRPLAGPQGVVALFFRQTPSPPPGWRLIRLGPLLQMVAGPVAPNGLSELPAEASLRRLTPFDAPAMVALAELTEPGPFRLRTIELGAFFGVFHGPELMAMAGQRLRLPDMVELSGVCTHSGARGRGYARLLMARVMEEILAEGKTPFLHVLAENEAAIRVYRDLGFVPARDLVYGVFLRQD